ncbi:MAG TPA: hypothetical protein VIG46_01630 [Candidatus Baltobacteraceae bacterium]
MSAEWLTAIASLLTLVVVAVAAFAALRQIRHMHSANQVAALLPLTEKYSESAMRASLDYAIGELRKDLEDPEVRAGVLARPAYGKARAAMPIFNFYESVGALVRAGTLDLFLVLLYFTTPGEMWEIGEDYIALTREGRGQEIFENFEALVILQRRYERRRGTSLFPRNMQRLPLSRRYLDGAEDSR